MAKNGEKEVQHVSVLGKKIFVDKWDRLFLNGLGIKSIDDIQGIGGISNLKVLTIKNNRLTSIPRLEGMEGLEHLELDQNAIESIENLDLLPRLKVLYLNGNQIEDIQGLDACKSLEILQLGGNKISTIQGLQDLPLLKSLVLGNAITKIQGLDSLEKLTHLYLDNNQIAKIESLEKNLHISILSFNNNRIKKVENLNHLEELEEVYLDNNELYSIDEIKQNSKLRVLKVNQNHLKEIGDLSGLSNLIVLEASHNQISKVKGLPSGMVHVNLSHNELTGIPSSDFDEGPDRIDSSYDFSHNQIEHVESGRFTTVGELNLESNMITNANFLEEIDLFDVIYLRGNPVEHIGIPFRGLHNVHYDYSHMLESDIKKVEASKGVWLCRNCMFDTSLENAKCSFCGAARPDSP